MLAAAVVFVMVVVVLVVVIMCLHLLHKLFLDTPLFLTSFFIGET